MPLRMVILGAVVLLIGVGSMSFAAACIVAGVFFMSGGLALAAAQERAAKKPEAARQ